MIMRREQLAPIHHTPAYAALRTRTVPPQNVPVDPASGRALHADLLDRFKSLSGGDKSSTDATGGFCGVPADEHDDNDKTVEELLADLGPADQVRALGHSRWPAVNPVCRRADS